MKISEPHYKITTGEEVSLLKGFRKSRRGPRGAEWFVEASFEDLQAQVLTKIESFGWIEKWRAVKHVDKRFLGYIVQCNTMYYNVLQCITCYYNLIQYIT